MRVRTKMRMRKGYVFAIAIALAAPALTAAVVLGQAPARGATAPAKRPVAPPASAAPVLQVMRGILYPSSNVVFAAQGDDPDTIKKAPSPATATDPLASTYG